MDGFQDLLGRLNGKSQGELGKAQKIRETLKRNLYAERRWGTLRFVSGGLLVGDRMEEAKEDGEVKDSLLEKGAKAIESVALPILDQKPQEVEVSLSKSKKKSKKLGNGDIPRAPMEYDETQSEEDTETAPADDKAQRRLEKAQRKLQRRLRREARQEKKIQNLAEGSRLSSSAQATPLDREPARDVAISSQLRSGIQTVRHRHIRQKKLAMTDSKALKEVT